MDNRMKKIKYDSKCDSNKTTDSLAYLLAFLLSGGTVSCKMLTIVEGKRIAIVRKMLSCKTEGLSLFVPRHNACSDVHAIMALTLRSYPLNDRPKNALVSRALRTLRLPCLLSYGIYSIHQHTGLPTEPHQLS